MHPALLPFKPIIDKVLDIFKYIPANVFSICVVLRDAKFSKGEFSACAALDATVVCFLDSCAWKGKKDFGCFTMRIPRTDDMEAHKAIEKSILHKNILG